MSADGKDLVRRFYAALNRRDADAMNAELTDDAELHMHISKITGRVYRAGHLDPYLADIADVWEDVVQTLVSVRQLDSRRVLASVRFQAAGRGSGVASDQLLGVLFDIRDGRIAGMRAYASPAAALESAGLPD